jgi:hypothetical protein
MDFIIYEINFIFVSLLQQLAYFVPLRVEVTVCNTEIAEHGLLPCSYSHLSVSEDYIIAIIDHTSDGSLVLWIFVGIVFKVVKSIAFSAVER